MADADDFFEKLRYICQALSKNYRIVVKIFQNNLTYCFCYAIYIVL